MENQMEAHLNEEFKLWSFVVLCQSQSRMQATNQVANHLQVMKSPPSCEITNSTCKIKVQTCKMDNSMCESPCEIHLCNLRYLQPT